MYIVVYYILLLCMAMYIIDYYVFIIVYGNVYYCIYDDL